MRQADNSSEQHGPRPAGEDPVASKGVARLIRHAGDDPVFFERFLEHRGAAATEIGVQLTEAEQLVLRVMPRSQLESIVDRTRSTDGKTPIRLDTPPPPPPSSRPPA